MALIKEKAKRYEEELGIELPAAARVLVDKSSVYYPVEQYDLYQAGEADNISLPYNSNIVRFQARKTRSTFFNPLSGVDFDTIVNPIILEPTVQLTTYMKVQYGAEPPTSQQ